MIEIAYMILYACIGIIGLLSITRKMSMGIGIIGILLGLGVAWILAPYLNIVMLPVGQFIWYGASLNLPAILGLTHLMSMISLIGIGAYNLLYSGGKIVWA